jgi:hypothetical protein
MPDGVSDATAVPAPKGVTAVDLAAGAQAAMKMANINMAIILVILFMILSFQ